MRNVERGQSPLQVQVGWAERHEIVVEVGIVVNRPAERVVGLELQAVGQVPRQRRRHAVVNRAANRRIGFSLYDRRVDLGIAGTDEGIDGGSKGRRKIVTRDLPDVRIYGDLFVQPVIHLICQLQGQVVCQLSLDA